jgi:hypothetical protein
MNPFSTVWSVTLGFKNPSFIFAIHYIRWSQSGSIFGSIVNYEENYEVVDANHLCDGD